MSSVSNYSEDGSAQGRITAWKASFRPSITEAGLFFQGVAAGGPDDAGEDEKRAGGHDHNDPVRVRADPGLREIARLIKYLYGVE